MIPGFRNICLGMALMLSPELLPVSCVIKELLTRPGRARRIFCDRKSVTIFFCHKKVVTDRKIRSTIPVTFLLETLFRYFFAFAFTYCVTCDICRSLSLAFFTIEFRIGFHSSCVQSAIFFALWHLVHFIS